MANQKLENLKISQKSQSSLIPKVDFNASSGLCSLTGDSMLENTNEFYQVLSSWFESYYEIVGKPLTFDIKMNYFNTASSQALLSIIKKLRKYKDAGHSITINWHYMEEDGDMLEEGEDFIAESKMDMNLIAYPNEFKS